MAEEEQRLRFTNHAADVPVDQIRDKMISIFGPAEDGHRKDLIDSHPTEWNNLWKTDFLPWDQGIRNPALAEAINTVVVGLPLASLPAGDVDDGVADATVPTASTVRLPSPTSGSTGRRLRALVPGCGRGYDVFYLASVGYDAVGLDVSVEASEKANALYRTLETADWPGYPVLSTSTGRGSVEFRVGDFFTSEWESEAEKTTGWDMVFDYTFLCALPPAVRPAWATRMSSLVGKSGHLICVEFPTYKDPLSGGPPWALTPAIYLYHLLYPGIEIAYDKKTGNMIIPNPGSVDSNLKSNPLTRILHWKARQTHARGAGTDWIGIWTGK